MPVRTLDDGDSAFQTQVESLIIAKVDEPKPANPDETVPPSGANIRAVILAYRPRAARFQPRAYPSTALACYIIRVHTLIPSEPARA